MRLQLSPTHLFIYLSPAQSGRTRTCPFHWSAPSEIYRCCSKRLQRAHKGIFLTRRLSTSTFSLSIGGTSEAERAEERSEPSTAIPSSNCGDGLTRLYEQITEMQTKENFINPKTCWSRLKPRLAHGQKFFKKK